MSAPVLVVIDLKSYPHPRYSRFEGRKLTNQYNYLTPLSGYWVEEMRRDPAQFKIAEAEQP